MKPLYVQQNSEILMVIALAITWIFVAIIVVAATFTGFAKYFDRKTFAFSYTPNSAIWDAFYSAFGEVATTPIIFIAILIIYRVYKLSKHSTTRNNNGEIAAVSSQEQNNCCVERIVH
ncbi:unnamed protein product [Nippostrongylus brasiliensis]|uniref:Uncharacterized protein n=1 Tax=Nippostrongylus brasiliensis TaxID=27835 RepID=A0A0N4XMN2_NIPBR|nr:unnamed protein product [Nippostrongylus brasiliensis]